MRLLGVFCLLLATAAAAQDEAFPTELLFGDTHVHTLWSADAFALGTRLGPEEAYRFAKGAAIRGTGGSTAQLDTPLDFLLIADHAENLGVVARVVQGDADLPDTPAQRRWAEYFADLTPLERLLNAATVEDFDAGSAAFNAGKAAMQADFGLSDDQRQTIWSEVIAAAERHNAPGEFTTFVGFEWSARFPNMIHRNVLFADGPQLTSQILPFSRFDSDDVEDLWAYLDAYTRDVGGRAIAIPHNPNLSGGLMFSATDQKGRALSAAYAAKRARWEPLLEVTQIKGDSEAHPALSPDDAHADFETWGGGAAKDLPTDGPLDWARQSYARPALGLGLRHGARLGVNPFKFGMIGSTDSHTALATADERAFWGKMGLNEPSKYRAVGHSIFSASGYAAVWAHANTRDAIFAALQRKETYATTGPRIGVRFFGGWTFTEEDLGDLTATGYRRGVPMGGDLVAPENASAPTFLLSAVRDPNGAGLERVQIIKGWLDDDGAFREKVHDVVVEPEGRAEIRAAWRDPEFDETAAAFYYLRVLEVPTPRWTAYDAEKYGLDLPPKIPTVLQDRAYTSPIWYTPGG